MDRKRQVFGLIVLFAVSVQSVQSLKDYIGETSIGKRREYLDSDEKYLVEWEAYTDTQTIVFQLTAETTGFVGFGISPVGGMAGADIIIGGVHPNASRYFSNRHGVGNRMPEIDDNETWQLLEASENSTHTYLKVCRQLSTCDLQDVAIGNSTTNFIWSMGKAGNLPRSYRLSIRCKPSYFLLEVHLDNPQSLAGQYDAAIMMSGHYVSFPITVPPKSENHIIVGHCASICTSHIPETGIHVFNILLHSHLAGRKLRLRHFRNGKELPWLATDDNYDFNFQQNRPLLEEVTILPGDQLTTECTYNNMDANGTVIGGIVTSEEMCNTFFAYYPAIGIDMCSSTFPSVELMKEFGIESYRGMANKTYTEVLDTMIDWTEKYCAQFQQRLRYDGHEVVCGEIKKYFVIPDLIGYPKITKEYAPADECATRNLPASGNRQAVTQLSLNIFAIIFVAFAVMLTN